MTITTIWHVHPARTQIGLGIRQSMVYVAKDLRLPQVDNENYDLTGRVHAPHAHRPAITQISRQVLTVTGGSKLTFTYHVSMESSKLVSLYSHNLYSSDSRYDPKRNMVFKKKVTCSSIFFLFFFFLSEPNE